MADAGAMRSYKLTQFGAPLSEVIEVPPAPKETQVLLRVSACGVCHSDLHVADGYFDLGQGQKLDLGPAVKLPRVLGHEIAGVVEELGPEASGVTRRRPPCGLRLGRVRTMRAMPRGTGELMREAAKSEHPPGWRIQQLCSRRSSPVSRRIRTAIRAVRGDARLFGSHGL